MHPGLFKVLILICVHLEMHVFRSDFCRPQIGQKFALFSDVSSTMVPMQHRRLETPKSIWQGCYKWTNSTTMACEVSLWWFWSWKWATWTTSGKGRLRFAGSSSGREYISNYRWLDRKVWSYFATIVGHSNPIGRVKKLDEWIPHELREYQKRSYLEAGLSLLPQHGDESFLTLLRVMKRGFS